MPAAIPLYTVDDLERFPNDGNRYELLEGALLVTPAPGVAHELIVCRLTAALHRALEAVCDGFVFTHGAVVLRPRTQLEPDLLVSTVTYPVPQSWDELSSHWLAVEVLSRASYVYDRDFKCAGYLRLGVEEVWLVDRWNASVEIARADGSSVTVRDAITWQRPELQSPLRIELAQLFAGL